MVGAQGLVRWDPQYTKIVPNVAKSFEVDPTGKVFTFPLRKGMKWSDGKPFTADDVLFNVEDLVLNAAYAPTPARYTTGGKPMKVEKVDDATVRFTFAEPYGDFLAELASPLGQHPVLYAKHYCSQFHPKHNSKIDETVKANNASDWKNLFQRKCGDIEIPSRWGNPERPTLDPWVVKEPYVGGATRVVMERNPYFWQVDPEGQAAALHRPAQRPDRPGRREPDPRGRSAAASTSACATSTRRRTGPCSRRTAQKGGYELFAGALGRRHQHGRST